jgi:flagellar basal body-associated protein FliL
MITLWIWIVAIVLTTSLVTVFTVNKTQKIEATITDMRKVPKSLSGTFCDGASIVSHNSKFTAFLFDGEPSQTADLQEVTFRKKTQITYNNYEYWGFYLLSGSVIQVSACPDSTLEFTIIQGHKNFKEFQNDDCQINCAVFRRSTYCNDNKPDTYQYTVTADEEYYLIFSNGVLLPFPTNVVANFTLKKRQYNLGNSDSECSNDHGHAAYCDLLFPSLNYHPVIVLNVTSSSNKEGDADINVYCNSRKWVYVMIFCVVPLVLGALGSALLFMKFRNKPTQTPTSTQSSAPFSPLPSVLEENESVPSNVGSGYRTVTSPPKYDDKTGCPPSYEEATK